MHIHDLAQLVCLVTLDTLLLSEAAGATVTGWINFWRRTLPKDSRGVPDARRVTSSSINSSHFNYFYRVNISN